MIPQISKYIFNVGNVFPGISTISFLYDEPFVPQSKKTMSVSYCVNTRPMLTQFIAKEKHSNAT